MHSVRQLFLSRWWTIGFAVARVAWVLHVAAMSVAPLSLVQATIAGGLVLIAYPATRYFGHKLNRREWLGLGLAAAGLGFLAVTVPHASENEGYSIATLAGFETVMCGAGCFLFASGIMRRGSICHGRRPRARLRPSDRRLQRRDQGPHGGHRRSRHARPGQPLDGARRDRRPRRLLRARARDAARRGDPGDRNPPRFLPTAPRSSAA